MSVDNSAILYVGLPLTELTDGYDNPDEFFAKLNESNENLGYRTNNDGVTLIGLDLGDSGSYGCIEIEYLPVKIKQATDLFIETFKKEPKVYLFNLQW